MNLLSIQEKDKNIDTTIFVNYIQIYSKKMFSLA